MSHVMGVMKNSNYGVNDYISLNDNHISWYFDLTVICSVLHNEVFELLMCPFRGQVDNVVVQRNLFER